MPQAEPKLRSEVCERYANLLCAAGLIISGTQHINLPVMTGLGWMYQGDEISCASPRASLNVGNLFAVHTWLYITHTDLEQTLFCKQILDLNNVMTLDGICVRMKNGMWYAYMNPDASLIPTPNTDPTVYNGLKYPWGETTDMAEIPLGVTVHGK